MNRTFMSDLVRSRPQLGTPSDAVGLPQAPTLGRHWRLLRLLGHTMLMLCALAAASLVGGATGGDALAIGVAWLTVPLVIGVLAVRGAYSRPIQLDTLHELLRVIGATTLVGLTVIAVAAIADYRSDPTSELLRAWAFSTAFLCAGVPVLAAAERRSRRSGVASLPALIVGAGQIGTQIERRLSEQPELGLRVVGYVDADPAPWDLVPERQAPVLGPPEEFAEIARSTGAEHVILTFTSSPDSVLMPLVRACEERGLHVWLVPRLFESVNLRLSLDSIGPLPLFGLKWVDPKGWQFAIKHAIDRVASAALLLALSPLLLAIAVAVRLSSPGPVLFRQRRIGRDGQRFEMLKFRSMRVEEAPDPADWVKQGVAPGGVEGVDRRTLVGCFIRRYSLDELPQLINVLRGEMSLIGPRPERPDYVEVFDERVRRYSDRHRVKSGITGLAQINGFRGQTSLPERVELDNYYIQNWSMALDLKILLRTFGAIFDTEAE
jgi:exopolysaccharide biosynthesis polyprenyl glycosylphosphotransferase